MKLFYYCSPATSNLLLFFSREDQYILRRDNYDGETHFIQISEKHSEDIIQRVLHYKEVESVPTEIVDKNSIAAVFEAEL